MSCEKNAKCVGEICTQQGIPGAANKVANLSGGQIGKQPPVVQVLKETKRMGQYQVGPLPTGVGTTIGNALRRTLLSSIPGAAVTTVKVKGITHEFSTIPNVREDMTALILNLKNVRFKFKSDKPATIHLKHKGSGPVTAADLVCPPHAEVANSDQPLFTADNDRANVDLTLAAQMGTGYSSSEDREPRQIGTIPIDAVFSPIRQVSFKVERAGVAEQARQGQPFEQVKISLTTDGTCSPEAALRQASAQLSQQFTTLSMQPFTRQKPLSAIPYHRSLANLKLQSRTLNALQRNGFHNINSVMKHIRKDGISHIKGLGNKSQDDLLNRLEEQNLSDEDQLILQAIRQGEYKPRPRKQSENVDIEEVR